MTCVGLVRRAVSSDAKPTCARCASKPIALADADTTLAVAPAGFVLLLSTVTNTPDAPLASVLRG